MVTKVTEYMTQKVLSVHAEKGIREAFFFMKAHKIRHLPVIDDSQQLVGMISDREIRRPNWVDEAHDVEHIYHLDDHLLCQDVMDKRPMVLHTYDSLGKAVKLMKEHKKGALPVLDKTQQLVGILSAVDLLQALEDVIDFQKNQKSA
ncbi:MAG: CBS domain-containing protein [Methylococcales bacterium]|jgi:acetoin utilization protein AcuB|nr:CBS domain-containing protein [Methylococcales bacterium]MBT7444878.1 CBS domain-containing protein [Methylococcales bacterium]